MTDTNILSHLRVASLFQGLDEHSLKDFAQYCDIQRYDVGEYVRVNPDNIPIYLLSKGCVAATSTTGYGRYERVVLALLMPTQLLCEFEYFGNKFPDNAGLKAIDRTEIISFPPKRLEQLITAHPQVMYNLARTLVTKINICNFHLEAVSQTKRDRKIATMLSGFIKIAEWRPAGYSDALHKMPMALSIVWDIELLTRFLSCDSRTIREGLFDLHAANLIDVEWLDASLTPIQNIDTNDIKQGGRRNSRIDEKTYFRITIKNPSKLEDYCAD